MAKAIYIEPHLFERAESLPVALAEMRRLFGSFDSDAQTALGSATRTCN